MRQTLKRRALITGLVALVTAPPIVRASSLMPVKTMRWPMTWLTVNDHVSIFDGDSWLCLPHQPTAYYAEPDGTLLSNDFVEVTGHQFGPEVKRIETGNFDDALEIASKHFGWEWDGKKV